MRMLTALVVLVAAVVLVVLVRHHQGRPIDLHRFRHVLDRLRTARVPLVRRMRPSRLDAEYVQLRRVMILRIARAAAKLPVPVDGAPLFVTIRVHPADAELVGQDVIADEVDINLALSDMDTDTRVRVRQYVREEHMPRTRVHVSADEHPATPRTRALVDTEPPPRTSTPHRTARLVLVDEAGTTLELPTTGGVIGRDAGQCQVVVDRPTVSRRHARISPRAAGFEVEDLDSANGISINSRTTTLGMLHHGDILGLGRRVRLRLDVDA